MENKSVDLLFTKYINMIRNNYKLEIFNIVIPDPDPETGEIPDYFDPKAFIEENICKTIDRAKNAVNNAFLSLFNNLEAQNGEHQNFIIINAISEMIRGTPSYSFTTKEFTDKLEYAYTCGQLYASYAKGCTGEFLDTPFYNRTLGIITTICNTWQHEYEKFLEKSSNTSVSESIPKITQFWNKYSGVFSSEILPYKAPFEKLAISFEQMYNKIIEYKDLGINAAKYQAVGNVFPGDEKRLQVVYPSMDEVFSACRHKFKLYDTLVDSLYELWLETITHVEKEYSDTPDFEKESLKSKIYIGVLLEKTNFYNDAQKLYQYFLTFFKQYNIL